MPEQVLDAKTGKVAAIAAPQYHNIPQELIAVDQWINFSSKWSESKNKWTKPPCNTRGVLARGGFKNKVTYEVAKHAEESVGGIAGVGYVLDEGDPDLGIIGLDFDHVVDVDGTVLPEVAAILADLGSYTEYSISGDGLHVFVEATGLDTDGTKKIKIDGAFGPNTGLEVFVASGYMTVSGKRLDQFGTTVRSKCKTKVAAIIKKYQKKQVQNKLRDIRSATSEPMFGEIKLFCEEFTERTGIEVAAVIEKDEGVFMIKLCQCPWGGGEQEDGETHDDGPDDAVIFFKPGRRPIFSCFHTTCGDRHWDSLCKKYPELPTGGYIDRYNSMYCMAKSGGKTYIVEDEIGSKEDKLKTAMSVRSFLEYEVDDIVTIPNPAGEDKVVSLANCWMKSGHARKYPRGFQLKPNGDADAGAINLWVGFAKEPNEGGCCDLFNAHWLETVCGGDEKIYQWTRSWFADILQNPGTRPVDTSIIVKGEQGNGKSIIASVFGEIIGSEYYTEVGDSDDLARQFNSHVVKSILVAGEEITFHGDKKGHNKLKHSITAKVRNMEGKGKEVIKIDNMTRFFISTNADNAIPAERKERRFLILDVDEPPDMKNRFRAIWNQLEKEGGYERLLWEMLQHKYEREDLRNAPKTQSLLEEKRAALHGIMNYLDHFIMGSEEFDTESTGDSDWPGNISNPLMLENCTTLMRERGERPSNFPKAVGFGRDFNRINKAAKLGFTLKKKGGSVKVWNTPPLKDAQDNWDHYLAGHS